MSKKFTQSEKNLIRRYLIWFYKDTKESLDKIDRYFTQKHADVLVGKHLKSVKEYKRDLDYKKLVDGFFEYMKVKEAKALNKKYRDVGSKELNAEYVYLQNRVAAVESAITRLLGQKELKTIRSLYEEEMTRRILSAREH